MKPEAPVTSALAGDMIPQRVTVMFDLSGSDLRSGARISGEIAIPTCGKFHRLGEREWRSPTEQRARLGTIEMEIARFGKAARCKGEFRPRPCGAELFDQITHGTRGLVTGAKIPVVGSAAIAIQQAGGQHQIA